MSKLPTLKAKTSLISKINEYLRTAANPVYNPSYKPAPRIKPSDLGSPCMRKILYSYLKTPVDQKIKPDQFNSQHVFSQSEKCDCVGKAA